MLIAPDEIFPWDKVDAAKRYLSAVKPWWGRFLDHFVIVPVEVMPDIEGVLPYGSTTATDRDLRIYIDRLFALSVPVHYLAGAIEHELQRHTRDSWQRFKFLKGEEWRNDAVPALDLEINSTLDREQLSFDMEMIEGICGDSAMFTKRELDYWNITAPPGLDDEGWVPRVLGLDDALSAEQYHQVLKKLKETPPPIADEEDKEDEGDESDNEESDENEDGGNEESGQPEENSEDGDADEDAEETEYNSEDSDELENEQSKDDDSENDEESDQSDDSDSEDEGDDDSGESDSEDEGDGASEESDSDQGEESSGEGDDDSEGGEHSGSSEGLHNDGGKPSAQGERSEEDDSQNEQGDPSESEGGEGTPGNGSAVGAGGTSGTGQPETDWEKAQAIKAMQESEIGQMWKNSIENPTDPFDHPAWKPTEDIPEYDLPDRPSDTEIAAAFSQLQEDIGENEDILRALASTFGSDGGSTLLQWREDYRRARGMNWTQRFMKLANALLTSVQIKGQSDLSYSVRNPNQQQIGPILQGLLAYSPTIYVLQDVSGSMTGNMAKSMSLFTDICRSVLNSFGDKITWFSADMAVRDVGKTSRWDEKVQRAFQWGFGGTESFGDVVEKLMTGKLIYKGKRYKKPDLVIVCTDCLFPWSEIRPRSAAKILVVNVGDLENAERFIPNWLDRRREFVQVDD